MSEVKDQKTMPVAESYDDMKLEDAMRRLDEVVNALDRENADLEASLALYEEGVRLVALCNRRLSEAERRINALKMTSDGEIVEVTFPETPVTEDGYEY